MYVYIYIYAKPGNKLHMRDIEGEACGRAKAAVSLSLLLHKLCKPADALRAVRSSSEAIRCIARVRRQRHHLASTHSLHSLVHQVLTRRLRQFGQPPPRQLRLLSVSAYSRTYETHAPEEEE